MTELASASVEMGERVSSASDEGEKGFPLSGRENGYSSTFSAPLSPVS